MKAAALALALALFALTAPAHAGGHREGAFP